MDQKMFCFQCEQTAGGIGCTGNAGVCGKSFKVAIDQDELTGALVGLSRTCKAAGRRSVRADELIVDSLFTCVTNVNFNEVTVTALVEQVRAEKERLAAAAGIAAADDLLLGTVWTDDENIRSLKSLILFGLRGMAAYAFHARVLGRMDEGVQQFFVDALTALGETGSVDTLVSLVLKVGEVNYKVMAMLDEANTGTYGTPEPTEVSLTIEKGPFIVVTGHDLHDLELLLKQTEGTGVSVYTHGEILPANAYPGLKSYAHLKGNFGTAWQNQRKEFDGVPGAFLFTTNCLMPPQALLCGSHLHDRAGLLPRDGAHLCQRGRLKGLLSRYREGQGARWLRRGPCDERHQRWPYRHDGLRPRRGPLCGRQDRRGREERTDQALLLGRWL